MANILKNLTNKVVTASCRKATGLDPHTAGAIIIRNSVIRDGKIYSPSGKKIGWINLSTGVGWCNMKGFTELKDADDNRTDNFGDYDGDFDPNDYDEVDMSEYGFTDYDENYDEDEDAG